MTSSEANETKSGKKAVLFKRFIGVLSVVVAGFIAYKVFFIADNPLDKNAAKKAFAARAMSVSVAPVQQGDVQLFFQGLGTIVPLTNVTVKSRVDGELIEVLFQEGQAVREGDVLAKIDSRSYEVQLKQAQGQFLKDQALLENALIDLKRYEVLLKQDSISKQVFDTQQALVHQYQGTLKVDEAAIDSAKLNIDYCVIKAPVSGQIGLRLVDKGNMMHASDTTGLAVITQVHPISATFTLPEDHVSSVVKALSQQKTLQTDAYDRSNTKLIAKGKLMSIDNQIDTATGTLKLKAQFDNADAMLFPNQFVNIHLLVETKKNALYVPSAAVQYGAKGAFVYRVNANETVSIQPIKVGLTQNGKTTIEEGLNVNDTVVVDGIDKLREGTKVDLNASKNRSSANVKSDATK